MCIYVFMNIYGYSKCCLSLEDNPAGDKKSTPPSSAAIFFKMI